MPSFLPQNVIELIRLVHIVLLIDCFSLLNIITGDYTAYTFSPWLCFLIYPSLTFFGAGLHVETHCFDYCFVSELLWWIHVLFKANKQGKELSRLRLDNAKPLQITFSYLSDHSEWEELSHVIFLWLPQSHSLLICQQHKLDFFNCFRCRTSNRLPERFSSLDRVRP